MDEQDKKRLQINSRDLIHNLMVSEIQDYLYERDILTQDNVEALLNDKSPQKAARRLVVTILPRKGPDAFVIFCESLREAGYDYLAEKLEATKVEVDNSCADNKCKDERNLLLRNSKNLEGELQELREQVKKVSVESENVRSEQERVKSKVDDLEYENYELKQQLSFYEEKEAKRKQQKHPKVAKSSSTGSFNIPGSNRHKQRNSIGCFNFETKMDDNVFRFDDKVHAHSTPLYDEIDITFLDELDNALCEKINDSSFQGFDDLDGPIEKSGESGKSNEACSSVTWPKDSQLSPTSARIRRRKSPKLNEEEDCELSFLLTDDIIGYFYTGQRKKPAELDPNFAQYLLVMRRAVDSMTKKHGTLIEQISRMVDISSPWKVMIDELQGIFNDFMAEQFHHSALFWGRTVALYALSGSISRKCARRHKEVQPLREYLTDFINVRLSKKIRSIGGWDTFCEFIEAGGDHFPAIFPASMIQAAITAASSQAHAQKTRTSPSASSSQSKEDMLKTI